MARAAKRTPTVINPRDAERRRSIIVRIAATAVVIVVAAAIGIGLIAAAVVWRRRRTALRVDDLVSRAREEGRLAAQTTPEREPR